MNLRLDSLQQSFSSGLATTSEASSRGIVTQPVGKRAGYLTLEIVGLLGRMKKLGMAKLPVFTLEVYQEEGRR
jgi:hypothetical protein